MTVMASHLVYASIEPSGCFRRLNQTGGWAIAAIGQDVVEPFVVPRVEGATKIDSVDAKIVQHLVRGLRHLLHNIVNPITTILEPQTRSKLS